MAVHPFKLLVLLAVSVDASLDRTPYKASSKVELYHTYTIATSVSYFERLGFHVLPIVILGIVFFFMFMFWSCGRCCRCCRPHKQSSCPMWVTYVLLAFVVALCGACIGMLIYGFEADKKQSQVFADVPGLVDQVVAWKDDTVSKADVLLSATNSTLDYASKLLSNSSICGVGGAVNCNRLTDIMNAAGNITVRAQEVINKIKDITFSDIRAQLADKADNADSIRHKAMIALIATLFSIIIIQALFSMSNSLCKLEWQPRKLCACKPVGVTIAILLVFFVLLMWLLAAILLFIATLFADFCIAPGDNVISLTGSTDVYVQYYVTCDHTNQTNPLQTQMDTINASYYSAQAFFNDYNATVAACTGNQYCSMAQQAVPGLADTVAAVQSAVGYTSTANNIATGLLGILSCSSLNGLVQVIFHLVCDDFFLSVAVTFEVFIAFACLLVLMEFTKRFSELIIRSKVPVRDIDSDRNSVGDSSASKPTIFGYEGNAGSQIEMRSSAVVASSRGSSYAIAPDNGPMVASSPPPYYTSPTPAESV